MSKPNRSGLPAHLRKDANGYFLDYLVGDEKRRKRVRLGHIPVAQAKLILAKHMQDIVAGKFLEPLKPKLTFNEAAQSYLPFSKLRKKTYKRDLQYVANLGAFFGEKALESLTPSLVEEYAVQRRLKRQEIGRDLKGSTLNREITFLKTIIRRLVFNRQLDRNPLEHTIRFKENPRNRTLMPEEYERLLEQCALHLKPMVKLAHDTAMRRGEILGLRWDQVDFQNGLFVLEETDTKTQQRREVPIDEALIQMLRGIPRTLGSPFVFSFKGKRQGDIKKSFTGACQRAGIKDFKFHDLRHCAITNFRKAGVPDNVIMSISGHKTTAMFRRYDSIDRVDRKDALERLRQFSIDTRKTPAVQNGV